MRLSLIKDKTIQLLVAMKIMQSIH